MTAVALPWMQAPPGILRGVLALATCTLMVLLTGILGIAGARTFEKVRGIDKRTPGG